ncbi:hypothetical protein [Deinococcus sp.]|uniref:hypothetical protein n=1 Tax=Deinococcus sp. TaxID=47478 RepID=UPI003B59A3F8
MTGRFAGLKSLQQDPPEEANTPLATPKAEPSREDPSSARPATPPSTAAATPPPASGEAARPWETAGVPLEPVKALNGRVPRSVRLAFDRQLTDAMDALGTDVTVDLAVEALARLVSEDAEVRERWLHKLWALKQR